MLEIIAALERLVPVDGVVDVVADIGLQHLRRDRPVIGNAEKLAEIVAQRRHHLLVARARPPCQRTRHQAVGQLVGGEADLDRLEPLEALHDLLRRRALLVCAMRLRDMRPVVGGAVVHVGEHAASYHRMRAN